jgi:adenylate cyclase
MNVQALKAQKNSKLNTSRITKNYGEQIIVSEFTKPILLEFAYRELDNVRIKGQEMTVAIFKPICKETQMGKATKDSLKLYLEALKLYRNQN